MVSTQEKKGATAAVVCGGAGGIGFGVVRRLLAAGRPVAVLDRPEALGRLAPDLINLALLPVDLTCRTEVEDAAARVVGLVGDVSVWVNAAGFYPRTTTQDVLELDADSWRRSMDVNLDAAVNASIIAAQGMVQNGGGVIVNVASGAGVRPRFPFEYSVAKAALIHATKCMALSLASRGVRVNAVAPGPTATPMISHILEDEHAREAAAQFVPLGRMADPDEVAAVVAFLCSDDARFVTGGSYTVDGGTSLT